MPRTCSVPGCKSNYAAAREPHVTTFAFPKDEKIAEQWKKRIQNTSLRGKGAAICVKHFKSEDVIKEDSAVRDDGTILTVPRVYPKLRKGALPTLFIENQIKVEVDEELNENYVEGFQARMDADPLEVNKSPEILKDAQKEISKLDVLVCGQCHDVFHYVEQFQEHRGETGSCNATSKLRETYKCEIKPQIWAFLLWKNVQFKSKKADEPVLSPWALFQSWSKLTIEEKEPWIVAGQNVLSITRLGAAKLQEIRDSNSFKDKPGKVVGLNHASNHSGLGDEDMYTPNTISKESVKRTYEKKPAIIKATPPRSVLSPTVPKKQSELRKALRTCKNDVIIVGMIDKIMNRRYNNKKKYLEYLIKWENSTENSWEPRNHLEKNTALLDEFDKMFNKNKTVQKLTPVLEPTPTAMEVDENSSGRPQRTSKKKALNQVKVWCGDIEDNEEEFEKRKYMSDDEDSSDSFEKKIKLEDESESSEEDKPSVTIRRIVKAANSVNGVPTKSLESTSVATSAPRVVRVSQKQMPSLASGVYLMSKTDGIVKIDSNSTASGSPLLKVGQKIGQTNVKVVKKDAKTPTKVVSRPSVSGTPKTGTSQVAQRKSAVSAKVTSISSDKLKPSEPKVKADEEESDGLEELEFPTNLPLPPPDSPPGDFTLCPLTGKILGLKGEVDEPLPENTSLDSLVKEVLDMPSTPEQKDELTPIIIPEVPITVIKTELSPTITTSTVNITPKSAVHTSTDLEMSIDHIAIVKNVNRTYGSKPNPSAPEHSILNKVLTNPKPQTPGPKKLLSTPHAIRPKVNYSVNKPMLSKPPQTTTPTIIHKVSPSRNRAILSKPISQEPTFKRTTNVTTYKPANVAKKIGSTTIYKNEKPPLVKKIPPPTLIQATQSQAPPPVISMPLLSVDDEPVNVNNAIVTPIAEIEPIPELPVDNELDELSTYSIPESETPILITGEDGTIYQVAGQNEEGQTILISEGADGTPQCVLVSSENLAEELPGLVMASSKESEQIDSTYLNAQTEAENAESVEGEETQVVAQIIKADPPSPGGTRKVVLMLPDGNLMVTEVTAEQYAALELDK